MNGGAKEARLKEGEGERLGNRREGGNVLGEKG
jgi:hypothetical protein